MKIKNSPLVYLEKDFSRIFTKGIVLIFGIVLFASFVFAMSMPDPYGDYDGDGVLNINDNCYYVYNPLQVDSDGDGHGNCCDAGYAGLPGYCDYAFGYCGDGICSGSEDYLSCPEDCSSPPVGICGDGVLDLGESCDDGINNGVVCDNSTSSCDYCDLTCEIITLPYEEEEEDDCCCGDDGGLFYDICESNWDCGDWSACYNGLKTRNCKDTNYCEYSYNKPTGAVGCDEPVLRNAIVQEDSGESYLLFSILGIVLILFLVLIFVLFAVRK